MSINIYEWDFERKGKSTKKFFKNCRQRNGLMGMNLDIWNNERVHHLTGYSVDDIKHCLHDLFLFIFNSLSPNRLENFDIESILETKMYAEN